MALSPDIMRTLLLLCLLGMPVLAALYLRKRSLSFSAYLGWGLLLVLVPLLGPFLVILAHPGERGSLASRRPYWQLTARERAAYRHNRRWLP